MKIGIIGAGIGGMAIAVRASLQGHDVEVYEANDFPGGKLSEFRTKGYRFDAGPSLFTMPQYVDELFRLAGENPSDYFSYEKLSTVCNYFWEDGTALSAYADTDKFEEELLEKLLIPKGVLKDMLADSRTKYELTGRIFLEQPIHKLKPWFSKEVGKAMLKLYKLDIFKSMHQLNQKKLKHPKLIQFFDRFATYNGSDPYRASGILNIIPHFEHHFGAFFPKGGMINITNALHHLAVRNGVKFHFNKKVEKIRVEQGKAKGIICDGENIDFGAVISNMDVLPTYKKLLPNEKHPERILKAERSSSALIFYWGIKQSFPQLDLHNIFFSDFYKEEFDAIKSGSIHHDPTVYVNISSKLNLTDAPEGCENWFTMINVPHNSGQNWDKLIPEARNNILKKLSRILGVNIEELIETEEILDPRRIQLRTSSHGGALYGTASNSRNAAFARHANFSRNIKGLYFCGGSVHPGGGIPLCLLSAKITADELSEF